MEQQRARAAERHRQRRRCRWDTVALLAPVVALCIIAWTLIIGTHFGMAYTYALDKEKGPPEPPSFVWSAHAAQAMQGSQTAEQAFTNGIKLTPCLSAPGGTSWPTAIPARSTTITWLFNSASYGLARIQAICDPPSRQYHLWLFVLQRDLTESAHPWGPNGGGDFALEPQSVIQPPPAWLPLPTDTYTEQPLGGPSYASIDLWDGQTHFFLFGHVADQAIRPADATSVTVDGDAGWLATANGLTTVTAVLSDGSTLFFSGTAAPAIAQSLAAAAFAHADKALPSLA